MTGDGAAAALTGNAIRQWVVRRIETAARPPLLMISGAQGIGKSTALTALAAQETPRIAVIGLDDVYHTQSARRQLAETVHPLCETRGAPGTHDLALLDDTLNALLAASNTSRTLIPRFDKRTDDRAPRAQWSSFAGRPDAIILEGWLMGVDGDPAAPGAPGLNALETGEDATGLWRSWQEDHLARDYGALWDRADSFLHLDAPSFEIVLRWRVQQEESTLGLPSGLLPPERRLWVARFIQHYERLTRRMLTGHRRKGDVIQVDDARNLVAFTGV